MISAIEMFMVVCDNCGEHHEDDYVMAWPDSNAAKEKAMEAGWMEHEGKEYCYKCFTYDEHDELLIRPERKKENV